MSWPARRAAERARRLTGWLTGRRSFRGHQIYSETQGNVFKRIIYSETQGNVFKRIYSETQGNVFKRIYSETQGNVFKTVIYLEQCLILRVQKKTEYSLKHKEMFLKGYSLKLTVAVKLLSFISFGSGVDTCPGESSDPACWIIYIYIFMYLLYYILYLASLKN